MPKVAKSGRVGGRKAGVPNKRTLEVQEKLEKLGCDPIAGMAQIAAEARGTGLMKLATARRNPAAEDAGDVARAAFTDLQLAGKMYAELAQYVAPKRKAVEVSAGGVGRGDFTLEELLVTFRRASVGP